MNPRAFEFKTLSKSRRSMWERKLIASATAEHNTSSMRSVACISCTWTCPKPRRPPCFRELSEQSRAHQDQGLVFWHQLHGGLGYVASQFGVTTSCGVTPYTAAPSIRHHHLRQRSATRCHHLMWHQQASGDTSGVTTQFDVRGQIRRQTVWRHNSASSKPMWLYEFGFGVRSFATLPQAPSKKSIKICQTCDHLRPETCFSPRPCG